MKTITSCLICNSSIFSPFLNLTDFLLTREEFSLVRCDHCGFRFINPQPESNALNNYYKSEDYISHHNNKGGLIPRLYRIVRNYSHAKKYALISKTRPFDTILDIGCATGEFLAYCKKRGSACTGIEPDPDARKFAQEINGINVKDESFLLHVPNNSFDIVTMWHVLEHVPDPHERLATIKRILKKDGLLIIALPNPDSFDAIFFNQFWAGWDAPRHLWSFSQENIKNLVRNYNFEFVSSHPMVFDSFYVSLLSNSYKDKRNIFTTSLYNGCVSNCNARYSGNYSSLIYVFSSHSLKEI